MLITNVFAAIDQKTDDYVSFWREICQLESPTADKAGVDAVGAYFAQKATERGWKIEILEEAVSGNAICITMNQNAKGAPIALSGHVDTVHAVGSFGEHPVRMENGRICGPGATDCKGGLAAAFLAMDALRACGFTDRPILLLLQSDEEVGSKTSDKRTVHWICEKAKGCAAFLNLEPFKKNRAVLTRKGILRYRLTVKGEAIHSSNCADGEGGINAIAEAAHKILELEKMKDKDGITCNCGVIEGGTVANTVPEHCSFVADIRFANEAQRLEAEEKLRTVAAHSYLAGSKCTVEQVSTRAAMEPSEKNNALLERMNGIFAEVGLPVLEGRHSNGGSDAAYTTAAGIPTVDSLGTEGGRIHSVEEFGELASLPDAAKRIAAIALML